MWDDQKRHRFQELRARESMLTNGEHAELALLVRELEDAEAAYLAPATERLQKEMEAVEAQNRALETLVRRKEALVLRLRDVLTETKAERNAIDSQLAAVLAGSKVSTADE